MDSGRVPGCRPRASRSPGRRSRSVGRPEGGPLERRRQRHRDVLGRHRYRRRGRSRGGGSGARGPIVRRLGRLGDFGDVFRIRSSVYEGGRDGPGRPQGRKLVRDPARPRNPQERSSVRPLTGYRRQPWGLGVHAPARGQCHKRRTHTLPSRKRQGSPRNHPSPRDPLYQWRATRALASKIP